MARATASPTTAFLERSPLSRPIPGSPTAQTSRATASFPAVMASASGVPASPRLATSTERPPLGTRTPHLPCRLRHRPDRRPDGPAAADRCLCASSRTGHRPLRPLDRGRERLLQDVATRRHSTVIVLDLHETILPGSHALMIEKYTEDRGAGPRSGEHGRSPQVANRERENARPMLTMTTMKHLFDGSWRGTVR